MVMAYAFSSSTWKTEAVNLCQFKASLVYRQPGPHRNSLSKERERERRERGERERRGREREGERERELSVPCLPIAMNCGL